MHEQVTLAALERLTAALVGVTARALAESDVAGDLTLPQWRGLVVVSDVDGIRVGDVAARLGISLPSASRLVRRLEQRGLVSTSRDESDRRATIVRSRGEGVRVRDDVIRRRRELIEAELGHATALPPETDQVLAVIASVLGRYG